jgi:hypothetical protein
MSDYPKAYFRFYHSEELREKTVKVLDMIEQSENPKQYRDALGDIIVELTNTGMNYFFIKPLELAKVGFVTQKSAKLGMAGTQRVIGSVMRRIIGGMNESQLLIICSYIRQLMR